VDADLPVLARQTGTYSGYDELFRSDGIIEVG